MKIQDSLTSCPQIKFSKLNYKRHSLMSSDKRIYEFTNNRLRLEYDEKIKCINSIWIKNDNIKRVSMFLVKNHIDINTINIDTTDYENHDVQVIHKIDIDGLVSLNKLLKNETMMLEIPYNKNCFVPNMIYEKGMNMNILFIIEPIEEILNKKYDLIIKYFNVLYDFDIRRCKGVSNERLIKRIESYHHNIDVGENNINIMPHVSLASIIINSSRPIEVGCHFECVNDDAIRFDFDKVGYIDNQIIDLNVLPTSKDPDYRNIKIGNKYTYVIDPYNNTKVDVQQPLGVFKIVANSCFKINATEKTEITITYVIFDAITMGSDFPEHFKSYASLRMRHNMEKYPGVYDLTALKDNPIIIKSQ